MQDQEFVKIKKIMFRAKVQNQEVERWKNDFQRKSVKSRIWKIKKLTFTCK